MINLEYASSNEIIISPKEVFRYLGYGKTAPDGAALDMIKKCITEINSKLLCKACFDSFPLSLDSDGALNLGFISVKSESLKKNLTGCDSIILFTATIGHEVDRVIQKYSVISPAYAVAAQAAGAAAIEEWCDTLCSRFAQRTEADGRFLRPRFSPGYGDLPLSVQPDIIRILDCTRKIGVSLTGSMLMAPSKSVSAIIGISRQNLRCHKSGCEACDNLNCTFRRS